MSESLIIHEKFKDQIRLLEILLNIVLPSSYVRFLLDRESDVIRRDLPILGLPIQPDTSSVWGATELLRAWRSDLGPELKHFVVIRLIDAKALCLDLRGKPKEDAPVVEIYLKEKEKPVQVYDSFEKYLEEEKVTVIEKILEIKFPKSYQEFLLKRESAIIDGFKIMGLPTKEVPISVLEGTLVVRKKREANSLVAISFDGTKALCLDLEKGDEEDASLVEVDLETHSEQKPLGKTFREWITHHEALSKRFSIAWNRIKARQEEAKRAKGSGIWNWSCVINRVRDYIIGVAAFRYSDVHGCLEVDEFYPVDQPHLKRGVAIKILLNEIFARARDYSGSLQVIFTKDTREDELGRIPQQLSSNPSRRELRPIPQEIVDLAGEYGISFNELDKGIISHQEGVNLSFSLLDLPIKIQNKIYELEEAGYLSREIIVEIITTSIWNREEVIWIFQNASRPEALLLGTDLPEERPFYVESLNWGRAVLLARRFQQAIMADLTENLSLEEIEKREERCTIEPAEKVWILKCNKKFQLPQSWMIDKFRKPIKVEAEEPVILLCRPLLPSCFEYDNRWIKQEIEFLKNLNTEAKVRCLLLSYEFISPGYNENLDEIRRITENASSKGITILFAPTRMGLYLDEEIRRRMRRARRLKHFPSRKGPLKLQIFKIPSEWWDTHDNSLIPRRIQNASHSARVFAEQIVKGRDVNQYRMEFSLMCEVIEREAIKAHHIITEVEGEDSKVLIEALQQRDETYQGVIFPYVGPDEMPQFLSNFQNLQSEKLRSIFEKVNGGIVITIKPLENINIPIVKKLRVIDQPFQLPQGVEEKIDAEIARRKREKQYVNRWEEIDRAHRQLRESLRNGVPLSMASLRSAVFIEMIKDYIYSIQGVEPRKLRIAYGDGSEGEAFPLFSLSKVARPTELFRYPVGLVSLRHMKVDRSTERALVRNREIQLCESGSEQEILAFRRTCECIDEFIRFLNQQIEEEELSPGFRSLLMRKPELQERKWNGLEMHIFHATRLEPAGIGVYRAVFEMLKKYREQLIVVPKILYKENYKAAEEWY